MTIRRRRLAWTATVAMAGIVAAALAGSGGAAGTANSYRVRTLVADRANPGHVDPNLVNGWGLAAGPATPWWVSSNEKDVSTLYDATGTVIPLVVTVGGGPTGLVFNAGNSFPITDGTTTGPARFLFSSEDGKIREWSPAIPPGPSTDSIVAADRSTVGAIYKGLAIAATPGGDRLYATDFHNRRIDVFDGSFTLVSAPGGFTDNRIPSGFAPFGIQAIGDSIFVSYAKQDGDREDDVAGLGLGFVDQFDTSGNLVRRVGTRGQLDSPWGLAMAPPAFGRFSGDLLVGNFGNGRILAYGQGANGTWTYRGKLRNAHGKLVKIDGLWALEFGFGTPVNGPADTLFFTAGPVGESHGRFGTIVAG
jgi:uncharacterized protein (TIGR03118 family)